MRVSLLSGFNSGLNDMLRLQEQVYKTNSQVSSGKRLQTPGDDPVAATEIQNLNKDQSLIQQYVKNTDRAESLLSAQDVRFDSINNALFRVKELTIKAGNGILSADERKGIAEELQKIVEQVVQLANSQDAGGEFIFSGYKSNTRPVERTASGDYVYRGDAGLNQVQVASSTYVQVSENGKDLFFDIPSTSPKINTVASGSNTGSSVVSNRLVSDLVNYQANSHPEDYVIEFNGGTNAFDVFRRSDILAGGAVPVFSTPATGASTTIDANAPGLDLGWEVTIAGVPATGDRFQVSSTENQSIFDTLQGITDGVANLTDSAADKAALVDLVSDTLANLQYAEKHINQARAFVGASLNTVETVRDSQQGIELVNETVLSEIRDLDMAEAISRLKLESLTLEASQQSFSRITRLSLFDFL